ncbi:MAG: RNB domain-containing ribonuclease, partial [Fibrobacterota bacterium]|nr:RNB domain-containing ribonuclease [Fibrobacterota bacterium]
MVRRVKGRKFVAEAENSPVARKRREKKEKRGKAPRAIPASEPIDIPIDEGAAILFDSDAGGKPAKDRPALERPISQTGGTPARKDSGPSRSGGGPKPGGSKFIPRGAKVKGGFREKSGRNDRNDRGGRDDRSGGARRNDKFERGPRGHEDAAAGGKVAVGDDATLIKGKLIRQGGFHFVLPGQAGRGRSFEDSMVLIPRRFLGNARPGDIVSARITDDEHGEKIGKIVATLREEVPFSEVSKHFFKEYGLPHGYPKQALAEAGTFPEPVFEDYADREDFRGLHIVTIDPSTAKDHDDAISLERKQDGTWLLGVHIADVAEYVTPDTSIDNEAVARAFTQYLPWMAAPMLP